jgi:DNA-binding CsgD family transcriptional regulator/tetratricopeptide (TPR) repeat protein
MTSVISDFLSEEPNAAAEAAESAACGGMATGPGRDAGRRPVRDLLLRVQRGAGGALLVEGEPGAGKSTLLRDAVEEASRYGFSLAAGAADQVGQAIPFFPLRQALGEPFTSLAAAEADHDGVDHDGADHHPEAMSAWWMGQIRAQLARRAAVAPVLVCLDDVQWAGRETLAALRALPRELRHDPVAWVLAASSASHRDAGYLFGLLEKDGAVRVRLAPLGADEVSALLEETFGTPPDAGLLALAAEAAGNPSLLTELVTGLREDGAVRVTDGQAVLTSSRLPARMQRVARRRLAGLGEQARNLAATAALLGSSFCLEDAAELLGATPAMLLPAVDEIMAAGIMAVAGDTFSFRHQLLRRAVATAIPPPGRAALHRQYGKLLLSRGKSAALAADHLLQSAHHGSPASLADLDAAAAQALRSAPQAAADLAVRAQELTPPAHPDGLPRAVAAAEALAAAGRLDEAGRIAVDTLARPLPSLAEARLRCALSSVLCSRGQSRDAAAEARMVLAQPRLPADLRDRAIGAHLQALAGLRGEVAGSLIESVLAAPGQFDGHAVVAALTTRAVMSWDKGRVSEGLELLRDAVRHETGISSDARHVQPLLALAAVLVDLRQLDQAEEILSVADNQALDGIPAQAAVSILRARVHLANGRLAEAAAAGEEGLSVAEALGAHGYSAAAHRVLGLIALRGGDISAAARRVAGDGGAHGPHFAEMYARAEIAMAHAQVTEARDGPAVAVTHIRRFCADLDAHQGLLLGDPAAAPWLARTALAAGDGELAATVARTAAALASGNPGYPALDAAAAHSLGLIEQDTARLAEAAGRHPDPWARASAAEDLGVALAQRGEDQGAVRQFTAAATGYQAAGATADTARVRRRLRKLGVRHRHWAQPAGRPAIGWESLTKTEHTVAELVAQGLSNKAVATRMYVSVHTVAFYLRQIFRKLDIGSRVQLTRIVMERKELPST